MRRKAYDIVIMIWMQIKTGESEAPNAYANPWPLY